MSRCWPHCRPERPASWWWRPGRRARRCAPSFRADVAGAIAARAGLLLLHHQIERDLHEVSRHIPTVVLPTGIEAWPAPWDFGQTQRLISTTCLTAERFLDGLRISGPGLYRVDDASAASGGPGETSISSTAEAGL